jgi:hypothetical protein
VPHARSRVELQAANHSRPPVRRPFRRERSSTSVHLNRPGRNLASRRPTFTEKPSRPRSRSAHTGGEPNDTRGRSAPHLQRWADRACAFLAHTNWRRPETPANPPAPELARYCCSVTSRHVHGSSRRTTVCSRLAAPGPAGHRRASPHRSALRHHAGASGQDDNQAHTREYFVLHHRDASLTGGLRLRPPARPICIPTQMGTASRRPPRRGRATPSSAALRRPVASSPATIGSSGNCPEATSLIWATWHVPDAMDLNAFGERRHASDLRR